MEKRVIKFRALDFKGNWQYGTYYFGVMYPTSFQGHYVNDTLIDEKTLGQFTGLYDKNYREIYEGDIYHQGDPNIRYKVIFNEGQFVGNQIGNRSLAGLKYWIDRIEPVGNIYENPELLKP